MLDASRSKLAASTTDMHAEYAAYYARGGGNVPPASGGGPLCVVVNVTNTGTVVSVSEATNEGRLSSFVVLLCLRLRRTKQ